MHARFFRLIGCACLFAHLVVSNACADVFQWQWVDPNDHTLGKERSTMLCADGAGLIPQPGALWGRLDLAQAYLYQADVSHAFFSGCNFSDAYFRQANLAPVLITSSNFQRREHQSRQLP